MPAGGAVWWRVIELAAGAVNRHKAGDPRVDRLHPTQQPFDLGDITDELGSREDVSPAQVQSNALLGFKFSFQRPPPGVNNVFPSGI